MTVRKSLVPMNSVSAGKGGCARFQCAPQKIGREEAKEKHELPGITRKLGAAVKSSYSSLLHFPPHNNVTMHRLNQEEGTSSNQKALPENAAVALANQNQSNFNNVRVDAINSYRSTKIMKEYI